VAEVLGPAASVSKIRCLLITFGRPIAIAIFAMVLLSRAEAIFTCPLAFYKDGTASFQEAPQLRPLVRILLGGDLNPILGFCFPLFSMVFP
jgi:hypothetical protein